MTLKNVLSEKDLEDIIVTAVEHFGYGSLTYPSIPEEYVAKHDGIYSIALAKALLSGKTLLVTDRYGDGRVGHIDRTRLLAGIDHAANDCPGLPNDWEDFDVEMADAAMQFAAWGEVVYG